MEDQVLLISEQFKHMVDVMDAELDLIELNQVHLKEMIEHRPNHLEKQGEDHDLKYQALRPHRSAAPEWVRSGAWGWGPAPQQVSRRSYCGIN